MLDAEVGYNMCPLLGAFQSRTMCRTSHTGRQMLHSDLRARRTRDNGFTWNMLRLGSRRAWSRTLKHTSYLTARSSKNLTAMAHIHSIAASGIRG